MDRPIHAENQQEFMFPRLRIGLGCLCLLVAALEMWRHFRAFDWIQICRLASPG